MARSDHKGKSVDRCILTERMSFMFGPHNNSSLEHTTHVALHNGNVPEKPGTMLCTLQMFNLLLLLARGCLLSASADHGQKVRKDGDVDRW